MTFESHFLGGFTILTLLTSGHMAKVRYRHLVLALQGSYTHIFRGLDDATIMSMNDLSSNKKAVRNPYKRNKNISNPYKK